MFVIRSINRVMMFVAAAAATSMMLVIIIDVAASFLTGRQIQNSFEIVAFYLMVAIVFLPMGSVELSNEHISTDLILQAMPERVKVALYIFSQLVGAGFVAVLCYQTALDAMRSFARNEMVMGTTMMITWPSRFLLPIGFGFLGICLLANAFSAVFKKKAPVPAAGGIIE